MSQRELNLPDSVFEWRRRREILPLKNFDFPKAHIRTDFDHNIIAYLTRPRMAGSSFQMSPEEIRDAIREGDLTDSAEKLLSRGLLSSVTVSISACSDTCAARHYTNWLEP